MSDISQVLGTDDTFTGRMLSQVLKVALISPKEEKKKVIF